MKPKTYWAGFVDGKMYQMQTIHFQTEHNTFDGGIVHLFPRRKDAKVYFDDVRKVEIREVK